MDKDKENNIIIPTREEFEDFCSLKLGYNDREFTSELWKTCQRVGRYWLYAIMASCFQNSVANRTNEHQYQKKVEKKRSSRITACTISPILTVAVITTRPQKQVDLLTS